MGIDNDVACRLFAKIPRVLLVISFGRVVWVMEKAGVHPILLNR